MTSRRYELLLPIVYAACIITAVLLQLSGSQSGSIVNIVINILMFIIVGIVFFNSWHGSLSPAGQMARDLENAAEKIRLDARDSHDYLLTPYQNSHTELFKTKRLQEAYRDFLFDLARTDETRDSFIKSDISDYIGDELIDITLHRPQLGQVAGAMTGLGILGTFIGLSLGLQSFNTGSTAQITNSIEPLMDGIKIAFHTSIYGMIFSLVFNYVFKRRCYEAEAAVSEFTGAFRKYVLPDTSAEGINLLIAAARDEACAIDRLGERVASEIDRVTAPQFEKLAKIIADFAAVATREQTKALQTVTDAFVAEMNASLRGTFNGIADAVESQYASQRENADLMRTVLNETKDGAGHFNEINRRSSDLIAAVSGYVDNVEKLEAATNAALENAFAMNADTKELLLENKEQLKIEKELLMGLQGTFTGITNKLITSHNKNAAASEELLQAIDDLRRSTEKLSKKSRQQQI